MAANAANSAPENTWLSIFLLQPLPFPLFFFYLLFFFGGFCFFFSGQIAIFSANFAPLFLCVLFCIFFLVKLLMRYYSPSNSNYRAKQYQRPTGLPFSAFGLPLPIGAVGGWCINHLLVCLPRPARWSLVEHGRDMGQCQDIAWQDLRCPWSGAGSWCAAPNYSHTNIGPMEKCFLPPRHPHNNLSGECNFMPWKRVKVI